MWVLDRSVVWVSGLANTPEFGVDSTGGQFVVIGHAIVSAANFWGIGRRGEGKVTVIEFMSLARRLEMYDHVNMRVSLYR